MKLFKYNHVNIIVKFYKFYCLSRAQNNIWATGKLDMRQHWKKTKNFLKLFSQTLNTYGEVYYLYILHTELYGFIIDPLLHLNQYLIAKCAYLRFHYPLKTFTEKHRYIYF